jgi:formyl-CoA transferase
MGILTALLEREVSGKGQWVQVSLLQAMISMLDFQAARWLIAKEVPEQMGNDHPTSIPTGVFPTRDGFINIAAGEQTMWTRLCKALGAGDLIEKPEYANGKLRSQNRKQCNADLSRYTKTKSSKEWTEILEKASVASGPIYKMNEVFDDPQVKHLGMAAPIKHPQLGDSAVVNQPFALSRTPSEMRTPTPDIGQHTGEILNELGYSNDQIADLRKRMVV